MLLKDMKVDQLRQVAAEFGVDVEGIKSQKGILDNLLAEGVTQQHYDEVQAKVNPEPEPVVEEVVVEPTVVVVEKPVNEVKHLIKMERQNSLYQTNGITFTRENPFAVVGDTIARRILERETGFRLANPGEAEKFYG